MVHENLHPSRLNNDEYCYVADETMSEWAEGFIAGGLLLSFIIILAVMAVRHL